MPTAAIGHMPFKGHRTCAEFVCIGGEVYEPQLTRSHSGVAHPRHPQSGTVAVAPRNQGRPAKPSRATKCSACCDYRISPCKWALCPKREYA